MSLDKKVDYRLGDGGEFVIENYNHAKPFASFFPGIAGAHGIPMWVFYVNRAQCVCSMGIEDKEHPIMEFLSANWAYELAGTQGFRTFVKILQGRTAEFYEPFQTQLTTLGMNRTQRMIIRPAELTLEEENRTLGLKFSVDYFNVPEDTYAGLVRVLRIENRRKQPVALEVMDGLPMVIPYGVDNYNLKNMRRLVESFVEVINYEKSVPFFKGRVKQEDRPEVVRIKEGNFYIGFNDRGGRAQIVTPIVDPQFIFGTLTDYSYPQCFIERTPFVVVRDRQILENRLPSGMGVFSATIGPGATHTYCSIIGQTNSVEQLNRLAPRIAQPAYIARKRAANSELIDRLTQNNFCVSAARPLDLYARQNFLDNVLRGGFPVSFKGDGKVTTVHLYSRKHGDLERDYNDYRLSATYYSQGNGNYRDVNQNRRNDLFFNPDVRESNVEHFANLIQLDGFNPLGVKVASFHVRNGKALDQLLRRAMSPAEAKQAREFFHGRFTPGQLFSKLLAAGIKLKMDNDRFLGEVLALCDKHNETDYGHGYWSDHWIYNHDLLENYLALYPENLRKILLEKNDFTFFDNPHRVVPRDDKYVLWEGRPMQLNAVTWDKEKEELIKKRGGSPYEARTDFGRGEIYRTTLVNKMLCLAANKLASLDPEGVGIEMESDKPNWYDALNGLPGQFGSSVCETLELKRIIQFLLRSFDELGLRDDDQWPVFVELKGFMEQLHELLDRHLTDKRHTNFQFWDQATTAKEKFRELTRLGISGKETPVTVRELRQFLNTALNKIERGIQRAWDRQTGILSTYFVSKVKEYQLIMQAGPDGRKQVKHNARGMPCFRVKKFQHEALPLFLEGPVHFLRIEKDREAARDLARRIKASGLYDRKLKMYKVNESLESQPAEIGRTKVFSRGWLENESIWLHMEYKYVLELLRCGLYREFYDDFKKVLVPYLDPRVYGRSILENSSFICSSANPDPAIHGNGFVARLSGSTAEFVHIFLMMAAGEKPFTIDHTGALRLEFKPALPAWLFTSKAVTARLWQGAKLETVTFPANSFGWMFLGATLVVFHNPKRKDTCGPGGVAPCAIRVTEPGGKVTAVAGGVIGGMLARRIRNREISRIDVDLG